MERKRLVNINYCMERKRLVLTHCRYCWFLLWKWMIQLPRPFSVAGARARHMDGSCPLYRDFATSSSSALIPTSPANACVWCIEVEGEGKGSAVLSLYTLTASSIWSLWAPYRVPLVCTYVLLTGQD